MITNIYFINFIKMSETKNNQTVQNQVKSDQNQTPYQIKVLDQGYIEFLGKFGDDLTIVNAARVSFGNEHKIWKKQDEKLLKYLWVNKHMSPFRHPTIRMKIHAPEVVMRQLYKHVVGIEATAASATKDHGFNEISGRYVEVKQYYRPEIFRAQSKDNKQASEGTVENNEQSKKIYNKALDTCIDSYEKLLDLGVAREQARMILPLAQYTTVIWTASLQAVLNVIELRDHKHSQYEIQEYARVMKQYIIENFPVMSKVAGYIK